MKDRINSHNRDLSSLYKDPSPNARSGSINTEEWWSEIANRFRGGPEEMIVRSASKFLRTTSKLPSSSTLGGQVRLLYVYIYKQAMVKYG